MSDLAFGRDISRLLESEHPFQGYVATKPRRNVRTLADDAHELYRRHGMFDHLCDDDAEPCSWSEEIDQRSRARVGTGRWASDDMEIDDGV